MAPPPPPTTDLAKSADQWTTDGVHSTNLTIPMSPPQPPTLDLANSAEQWTTDRVPPTNLTIRRAPPPSPKTELAKSADQWTTYGVRPTNLTFQMAPPPTTDLAKSADQRTPDGVRLACPTNMTYYGRKCEATNDAALEPSFTAPTLLTGRSGDFTATTGSAKSTYQWSIDRSGSNCSSSQGEVSDYWLHCLAQIILQVCRPLHLCFMGLPSPSLAKSSDTINGVLGTCPSTPTYYGSRGYGSRYEVPDNADVGTSDSEYEKTYEVTNDAHASTCDSELLYVSNPGGPRCIGEIAQFDGDAYLLDGEAALKEMCRVRILVREASLLVLLSNGDVFCESLLVPTTIAKRLSSEVHITGLSSLAETFVCRLSTATEAEKAACSIDAVVEMVTSSLYAPLHKSGRSGTILSAPPAIVLPAGMSAALASVFIIHVGESGPVQLPDRTMASAPGFRVCSAALCTAICSDGGSGNQMVWPTLFVYTDWTCKEVLHTINMACSQVTSESNSRIIKIEENHEHVLIFRSCSEAKLWGDALSEASESATKPLEQSQKTQALLKRKVDKASNFSRSRSSNIARPIAPLLLRADCVNSVRSKVSSGTATLSDASASLGSDIQLYLAEAGQGVLPSSCVFEPRESIGAASYPVVVPGAEDESIEPVTSRSECGFATLVKPPVFFRHRDVRTV